ncbi:MAG: hypothetical protein EOM80_08015 [Erysipelotrichia bacterium]|nr:hypothetical protein [Erysipelotrichia bacterium]
MAAILLLSSIVFFVMAIWLYRFPGSFARTTAVSRAAIELELARKVAINPAQSIRTYLSLLARMPVLRQMRSDGVFKPTIKNFRDDLILLIASYEQQAGLIWQNKIRFDRNLAYWMEIPDALRRRLVMGFSLKEDEEDSEEEDTPYLRINNDELNRMTAQTRLAPESIAALSVVVNACLEPVLKIASIMDHIPGFRSNILTNAPAAENLFIAALNDALPRTIILKNLHNRVIASAGAADTTEISQDNRDCVAIIRGTPFFSGPVRYDRHQQKPLWWVAVPVRNEKRVPIACLSALVDISFLSDIVSIPTPDGTTNLFFTDMNGVTIGHPNRELVAGQVNIGASSPGHSASPGSLSHRIINIDGQPMLHAVKNTGQSGYRFLPDWLVHIQTNSDISDQTDHFMVITCVFLLAVAGMYVLSCGIVHLFKFMNGEG